MELSEPSELDAILSFMRGSKMAPAAPVARSAPNFHDTREPEVDRLYHTSPQQATPPLPEPPAAADAEPVPPPAPAAPPTTTAAAAAAAAASDAKPGKPSTRVVTFSSAADSDSPVAAPPSADDEMFAKEAVGASETSGGGLSALFRGSRAGGDGGGGGGDGGGEAAMLALTIYLPDRSPVSVSVFDVASVDEAIVAILRSCERAEEPPACRLYYGHPQCYELRLHDGGGEPDEDFPALDRTRKIKAFGDGSGDNQYCLCEIPGTCPPAGEGRTRRQSEIVAAGAPTGGGGGHNGVLKVIMPNNDYTVLPVSPHMRAKELLPLLAKKHRLHLYTEEYVFQLTEADQQRLRLMSNVIDMNQEVATLQVEDVLLRRKIYADAPQVQTRRRRADGPSTAVEEARPDPSSFMFNDVTATMYKEWNVVKRNKFGKKQNRIMGVDLTKIYNKKVGDRGMRRMSAVTRAERLIANIREIGFVPSDPLSFRISYQDPTEVVTLEYTAENVYACAEIVAKIQYIRSRRETRRARLGTDPGAGAARG